MSVRARTEAPDASAAGPAGEGLSANQADGGARLLGRLSVLPALLVLLWLLAGLPLLLAGHFRLVPMLAVAVPLAVAAVVFGLRWTPGSSHSAVAPVRPEQARTPWWAVAGVLVVAVAFGADQIYYHSNFVIVTRDPASYFQFATWIARHGSLPIPQDLAAFGGGHSGLVFNSFAFFQAGNVVIPQFMAGLPMVLAAGSWAYGAQGVLILAPVLGAGGVLTFGGLVARLVGPRWAPAGALVLALSLPEQFTSRSDYSEPLAQILLLGGLCLIIDALNARPGRARILAALGGLALGLTLLVRIDGASDLLPVLPYLGLLFAARRPQMLPMLGGLLVGVAYGVVDGAALSWPYMDSIWASLEPLLIVIAVVAVLTVAAAAWLRRRRLPAAGPNWLVNVASAVAVLAAVGFTIRPYVQTVRGPAGSSGDATVAGFQAVDHLPVDPTRLYYEFSMDWVFWYVGVPVVILATLGAALLSRHCLRGRAPSWVLPLVTFAWTIVTTLYRPAITPDQPWASRRLVPAVLPGLVLLAVWALSWILGQVRRRRVPRAAYGAIAVVLLAALVLPEVATTYGLTLRRGGPAGVRLASVSTAFTRTYRSELGDTDHMCAALPADSSVVIIDGPTADRFAEAVRGMCGLPTGVMRHPTQATVAAVTAGIRAAGRKPVLLAGTPEELTPYAPASKRILYTITQVDENSLVAPPTTTSEFDWSIWMSEP